MMNAMNIPPRTIPAACGLWLLAHSPMPVAQFGSAITQFPPPDPSHPFASVSPHALWFLLRPAYARIRSLV